MTLSYYDHIFECVIHWTDQHCNYYLYDPLVELHFAVNIVETKLTQNNNNNNILL